MKHDELKTAHTFTDEQKQAVREAVAEALGDAYDCTRHWSAWSMGTMTSDDFQLVADDDARLDDISDAAIKAMLAALSTPRQADPTPEDAMMTLDADRARRLLERGPDRRVESLSVPVERRAGTDRRGTT